MSTTEAITTAYIALVVLALYGGLKRDRCEYELITVSVS